MNGLEAVLMSSESNGVADDRRLTKKAPIETLYTAAQLAVGLFRPHFPFDDLRITPPSMNIYYFDVDV